MGIRRLDSTVIEGPAKRCTKCKQLKPISDFGVVRRYPDGRNYRCKECISAYIRERHELIRKQWGDKEPSREGERRCSECGEKKPKTEFHHNKTRKDGLSPICKPCCSRRHMEYHASRGRLKIQFQTMRNRAARKRTSFDVTFDEFCRWDAGYGPLEQRRCPICNCTIEESKQFQKLRGRHYLNGFTVDRIDSQQGYTIENLQILCYICNTVKGRWFTIEEMQVLSSKLEYIQQHTLRSKGTS